MCQCVVLWLLKSKYSRSWVAIDIDECFFFYPLYTTWALVSSSLNHEVEEITLGSSFIPVNVCCCGHIFPINCALTMYMYAHHNMKMLTSSNLLSFIKNKWADLKGLWKPKTSTIHPQRRVHHFLNMCVFISHRSEKS